MEKVATTFVRRTKQATGERSAKILGRGRGDVGEVNRHF